MSEGLTDASSPSPDRRCCNALNALSHEGRGHNDERHTASPSRPGKLGTLSDVSGGAIANFRDHLFSGERTPHSTGRCYIDNGLISANAFECRFKILYPAGIDRNHYLAISRKVGLMDGAPLLRVQPLEGASGNDVIRLRGLEQADRVLAEHIVRPAATTARQQEGRESKAFTQFSHASGRCFDPSLAAGRNRG